ncbi:hypothetical protein ABIC47_002432 [Leifsonia sp. 563]|uniref:hypothetical protein n=1 Tax=Leifsonia sp. 563 TaxID=3156412 RepID=UPI003391C8C5
MTLHILRDDALTVDADRFELRISLPWIRSLPVSSLHDVSVTIDGEHTPSAPRLGDSTSWWFIQDRVVVDGAHSLDDGAHDVEVSFDLVIPYLPAGPDRPLTLPFRERRELRPGTRVASVSKDVA